MLYVFVLTSAELDIYKVRVAISELIMQHLPRFWSPLYLSANVISSASPLIYLRASVSSPTALHHRRAAEMKTTRLSQQLTATTLQQHFTLSFSRPRPPLQFRIKELYALPHITRPAYGEERCRYLAFLSHLSGPQFEQISLSWCTERLLSFREHSFASEQVRLTSRLVDPRPQPASEGSAETITDGIKAIRAGSELFPPNSSALRRDWGTANLGELNAGKEMIRYKAMCWEASALKVRQTYQKMW